MKNHLLIAGEIVAAVVAAALLLFWATHRAPDVEAANAKDGAANGDADNRPGQLAINAVTVRNSVAHDESPSLSSLASDLGSKDVSQSMAQSDEEEEEAEEEQHSNVVAPQQKASDAASATSSRSAALT